MEPGLTFGTTSGLTVNSLLMILVQVCAPHIWVAG